MFQVGDVILYLPRKWEDTRYVGRVESIDGQRVKLSSASWVHWTGRLSDLTRLKKFSGWGDEFARRPRTEYVGEVRLLTDPGVSVVLWNDGELPTASVSYDVTKPCVKNLDLEGP